MFTLTRSTHFIRIYLFVMITAAAVLSACGAPTAQSPTPSQPTAATQATAAPAPTAAPTATTAPTAMPQPTSAPTTVLVPTNAPEPTNAPTAAGVLPAPLYFVGNPQGQNNQIWRLEPDGKTRTKIVEEPAASGMLTIVEFAVSPADGSLAYLVQGQDGYTLVRTDADGANRKELLPPGSVNTLRWSPDGTMLAYAQFQAPGETKGPAGGIYLIPAAGGEPKLLQANDVIKDPANPPVEARGFSPNAWSPDGTRLLVNAFSQAVEICNLAVKTIASGDLVTLSAPEGVRTGCGTGAWSQDGAAIYVGMQRPGYLAPVPGLWRADAATGATMPFIPGEPKQGTYTLVSAPHAQPDGTVRAFVASTNKLAEPGDNPDTPPTQYAMSQLSVDGKQITKLRPDTFTNIENLAVWAPDGSGALIEQLAADSTVGSTLLWAPADGRPIVELAKDIAVNTAQWGAK